MAATREPVEVPPLDIPHNLRSGVRGSAWLGHPAYMCLLGNFTGDIWHCAAAQILYEYRNDASKPPFPFENWWPRTCISVEIPDTERQYAKVGDKKRTETQERDSKKNAKAAWSYLKSIGLPCTLAGVRFVAYTDVELANRSLTWEIIHKQDLDQEASQTRGPLDHQFEQVFQRISHIEQKPKNTGGPNTDDRLIPLLVITSLTMQLVPYLGVEESQIILGRRLCQGIPEIHILAAQDKLKKLEQVINQATKESGKRKVLLFNYRLGQVNTQHDSNRTILEQIKIVAGAKDAVVVIVPQMPKDKFRAHFPNSSGSGRTKDYIFDIYVLEAEPPYKPEKGVDPEFDMFEELGGDEEVPDYSDQRIKVHFWSLVAQTLQKYPRKSKLQRDIRELVHPTSRCIIGIIGGRSGSMDLPAFVGMNCFSWDEPLISHPKTPPDWSKWPHALPLPQDTANDEWYNEGVLASQLPQFLRLLNEWPLMRVGYLSRKGLQNKRGENTIVRDSYRYLDVNQNLDDWLDEKPACLFNLVPHEKPEFMLEMMTSLPMKTVANVNNKLHIEKHSLGIKAVNVDTIVHELQQLTTKSSSTIAHSGGDPMHM